MNLWLAFLGGVIIGWIIEWVIDWYYWRRGVAEFYAVETELRRRTEAAEAESAAARQAEEELRTQLQLARDEIAALRTSQGVQQPQDSPHRPAPDSTTQETLSQETPPNKTPNETRESADHPGNQASS